MAVARIRVEIAEYEGRECGYYSQESCQLTALSL
jgi:hypothetical protein